MQVTPGAVHVVFILCLAAVEALRELQTCRAGCARGCAGVWGQGSFNLCCTFQAVRAELLKTLPQSLEGLARGMLKGTGPAQGTLWGRMRDVPSCQPGDVFISSPWESLTFSITVCLHTLFAIGMQFATSAPKVCSGTFQNLTAKARKVCGICSANREGSGGKKKKKPKLSSSHLSSDSVTSPSHSSSLMF